MWSSCILFPDSDQSWTWSEETLVGLPALIRVLATLNRAGIQRAIFPRGAESLRPYLLYWGTKKRLPELIWWGHAGEWKGLGGSPVIALRGGFLFEPLLLQRFQQGLLASSEGRGLLSRCDAHPILLSFSPDQVNLERLQNQSLEAIAAQLHAPAFSVPHDVFCRHISELRVPGKDRELLASTVKATDRWHVRWVRSWSFPLLRLLAKWGVSPNQVSVVGFLVGLIGCILIAQGGYWPGVLGGGLLYLSWVLDCMDGTLARLTYSETPAGGKLDTILGHLTNLLVFSALIWAVYGRGPLWKAVAFACLMLGSIGLAHHVIQKERALRPPEASKGSIGKLQTILDKINHRDYALLVFVMALVRGFKFFLWGSAVGIQVFWLLHLWLIYRQRRPKMLG